MPTSITESSTFPAVLQTPNDGDPANQSSILGNFLQGLANSRRYLFDQVQALGLYVNALLSAINNMKALREIKTSGVGINAEALPDFSGGTPTGSWVDVAGSAIVMSAGAVGDELHVDLVAPFNGVAAVAGETGAARITVQSVSKAQTVVAQQIGVADKNGTVSFELSLRGKHTLEYAEAYTVKAQIKGSASGLGLGGGWFLRALRIDLTA